MIMCIGGAGLFVLTLILLAVFLVSEKKKKLRLENDYLKPEHLSVNVSEPPRVYAPSEIPRASGSKTTASLSETKTLPLDAKNTSSEETVPLDAPDGR